MTISNLQILFDLNKGNEVDVLEKHASWVRHGYLFVDSEDGQCYLFDENGRMDDIKKMKTLVSVKRDIDKIVIPNSVERIEGWAFDCCASLINIEIQNGIKSIGNYAFCDCTSLKSIEIPESVESIGEDAFWNCKSLTSIEIPKSVKSIGNWAFFNCISLKSIIFKGKTMDQVKEMAWYPWGIKDKSIIKCQKS